MSAAWMWVRLDLRRRIRSLLVLALLVALTTGVVLTAVAGSRRGADALDRLLEKTKPATIAVLPNKPGFDWDAVKAIDGVESVGLFPVASYLIDGLPPEGPANFPYDAEVMDSIERPVVLDGRLADPTRDDEVVISHAFEGTYGLGVGDTVTLRLYSPEQIDAEMEGAELEGADGPAIEARIVGVIRSPWFSDSGDGVDGTLVPSAGLFTQHRANFVGAEESNYVNALVRLEGGGEAVPAFREHLAEVTGRRDIEFFYLAADAQHIRDVGRFEADALLVFAAAAGIAALFLVGQSIVRYVAASTAELEVLQAVGMRPRQVRAMAAVGPTLAAVMGAAIGGIVAFLFSGWFPIGTIAPFEPSPGRRADLPVLLGGVALVIALVLGGALLASWLAGRSFREVRTARPSRLVGLTARAGAPVPVGIGTRFALERGAGPQAVPVVPALIGAIIGVAGIVGALTFAAGIDDATTHPERFGVYAQLLSFYGFNGEDLAPADEASAAIEADPDVVAVNDNRNGVAEAAGIDLSVFTIDPIESPPPVVMIEGTLPGSDDEVALAPDTAEAIGVAVGDRFELQGAAATKELTVSGLAFVPEGPHNEYDGGGWLTRGGFDRVVGPFKFHWTDITLREGADVDAVAARINTQVAEQLGYPPGSEVVETVAPPSRIGELKQLGRLPLYLAAFLALLAVTAVGHAVATAVRRRRHDLAVLRAIGLTRSQTRSIAYIQATVLALVGLVIGVPLGIAAGQSLWSSVAETTPVIHITPVAVITLILIAPVALLLAWLLAAVPSHRAASLRVGQVLRTE